MDDKQEQDGVLLRAARAGWGVTFRYVILIVARGVVAVGVVALVEVLAPELLKLLP